MSVYLCLMISLIYHQKISSLIDINIVLNFDFDKLKKLSNITLFDCVCLGAEENNFDYLQNAYIRCLLDDKFFLLVVDVPFFSFSISVSCFRFIFSIENTFLLIKTQQKKILD